MSASQLFGVNNSGHVFSLSTDQSVWQQMPYNGIQFKQLASHESVIWALGEDHQVYVYVYGSSDPIEVCEESYENQRFSPFKRCYTSDLLPTDRTNFSSEDGWSDRPLSSINLPTLAWTWEGQWQLQDTFEGKALDKEAWTYALDFPRTYTDEEGWYCHVRRRKWVRYRRYVALDTWSPVPPIHQEFHTQEPFIDISVGGGEVPEEDADKLMVWGVTALNRVMVREGVCGVCPEGVAWTHVPSPADEAVISVSVGRSGQVWAVTTDGVVLVRTGISRDNIIGIEWIVIDSTPERCLQYISVGVNMVWALTRDHKVWFRQDGVQQCNELGKPWLLMDGTLNRISVGPNDQVWGVTAEDQIAVMRTGVTSQEPAGRTWQPIALPMASEKIHIFNAGVDPHSTSPHKHIHQSINATQAHNHQSTNTLTIAPCKENHLTKPRLHSSRMSASQLFGVNNSCHVFSLSTDQSAWQEMPYNGINFKQLASHDDVIWALGEDHQVNVYVIGSSDPIRACEESYENQRFSPFQRCYTADLLPTDRTNFSSEDGWSDRPLHSINLPTLAWTWEEPWQLHYTFEGKALDKEAWTYALDFPRSYTTEELWNCHVRRRKWVRYRRYVALDTWSPVPPIHQNHAQEPFIDISIGGGEIPVEDADKLMVWGVTALNRVMVRENVCGNCPEGVVWTHIPSPADEAVISVSVGRSGQVWTVTWDGVVLVRTGISRDNPTGTEWIVIESPPEGCLQHIAVGVNVVWALTRDHKVWFRQDGVQHRNELGKPWLLMDGTLNKISVGPNDQVWGVTAEDQIAVMRTGVTPHEPAGRTWQPIALPMASEKIQIFNENNLQYNLQVELFEECCICSEVYNKDNYSPLVLPCGHMLCKECIKKVSSEPQSNAVQCPIPHYVVHDLLQVTESIEEQGGMSDTTKKILTGVGIGVGAGATGVAAVLAAPLVLTGIGFTSAGIATGSWAASMMSAAAIAEGGGVVAGSLVALLQSAGVLGLGAGAAAGVGVAGATVGAAAGTGIATAFTTSSKEENGNITTHEIDSKKLFVYSVPMKYTLDDIYNHLLTMKMNGHQSAYVPNASSQSISAVTCLI